MKTKMKAIIYIAYFMCVTYIIILSLLAAHFSSAFWASQWIGSYISFFYPFILNTNITIALAFGTIPVAVISVGFYRLSGISRSRFYLTKGIIIGVPAFLCFCAALLLAYETAIRVIFRSF